MTKHRADWTSFDEVWTAYQAGGWDGIGFVFTKDDPFCGIDTDDCRSPETGEILLDWAEKILKLGTFEDVSPTRTGVKIISKAKLSGAGIKRKIPSGGAIEIYDQVRYFTLTGHPQTVVKPIQDLQEQIGTLYDSAKKKQTEKPPKPPKSIIAKILKAIRERAALWNDGGTGYATLPSGAHVDINHSGFRRWVISLCLEITNKGASDSTLKQLVNTCDAVALCQGQKHKTYRRIARMGDRVEVDLGDETFEAVIISPDGWAIGKPTAHFLRHDNAKALPRPTRGATIDMLRPFVNVPDDQFPLFIGSILDAYKGHGDYLITAFTGEQETGKSELVRTQRNLVDPVELADLASLPRTEEELAIDCRNSYFLAFDNVSKLPQWLSDAFCRVATGGGVKTRQLYSNNEQCILDVCRPLALNGIEDFVVAGDLISRTVLIQPEVIPEEERLEKRKLRKAFHEACPAILGCIFDALSHGLRTLDCVKLDKLPRMADSAQWIAACFPAWGWTYQDWLAPYQESQGQAAINTLDKTGAAVALRAFMQDKESWMGTSSELFEQINTMLEEHPISRVLSGKPADGIRVDTKFFPKSPVALTNALRKAAPNLRSLDGIDFRRLSGKNKVMGETRRRYTITKVAVGLPVAAGLPTDVSCEGNPESQEKMGETLKVAQVAHPFPSFNTNGIQEPCGIPSSPPLAPYCDSQERENEVGNLGNLLHNPCQNGHLRVADGLFGGQQPNGNPSATGNLVPLSHRTGGEIPFDVPYRQEGQQLYFTLEPQQWASCSTDARSCMFRTKEGEYCYRLPLMAGR